MSLSVRCNSAADFNWCRGQENPDQASGSGDVAGWARVPGRCGWNPTIKVYMS